MLRASGSGAREVPGARLQGPGGERRIRVNLGRGGMCVCVGFGVGWGVGAQSTADAVLAANGDLAGVDEALRAGQSVCVMSDICGLGRSRTQ